MNYQGCCSIPSCVEAYRKVAEHLSYHKFPPNGPRQEWIDVIRDIKNENNWQPTKFATICSLHFPEKCFKTTQFRRNLSSTAVPSLFLRRDNPIEKQIEDNQDSFDMTNQEVCLLCLKVICDTVEKCAQQIRAKILFRLVTPCHQNSKSAEVEDDEICQFCTDCYFLLSTIGENKRQISLLEEEIGSKVREIQATILHTSSSSHLLHNGKQNIIQIRDMLLLRVTGENEEHDNNFASNEPQVKLEHIFPGENMEEHDTNILPGEDDIKFEDETNPLGDVSDELLYDDINSFCEASMEKTEKEDFIEDEDEESAFCIIPWPQTKDPNENPKCTKIKNIPMKRRTEGSPPLRNTITKKNKLQPDITPTRELATMPQISPTTKEETAPPIRFNSLVQVRVIKAFNPMSNSESSSEDDDTKATPDSDDEDLAPSIEFVDSISTSAAIDPCPHKCTSCSKSFTTQYALTRHSTRDHSIPCIAPSCTATFRSISSRDAHLKTTHEGISPHQCKLCKAKFRRQNGLAAHMVIRHEKGEKKLTCVKCGKKFCLEENLARHLKLHEVEGIKPVVCDVCDARFEDEARLFRHAESHQAKTDKFHCPYCGKGYTDKTAMEKHSRTHTGEKTEKCPHCDATFVEKPTLQRHILRDHSSTSTAPHICHICGKGFYLPVDLKVHLNRHEGKNRVKCDTCGETFVKLSSLQSHRVRLHGQDPFVCDECGSTFTSDAGLRIHNRLHVGNKKHKCQTCGACFFGLSYLNVHMRTHTGERPYPCPHCDKAFKTRTPLNLHVKSIHTPGYVPPTPHKCPHCDKGFKTPFFLRGHIRQAHTGERPFICDQCGKGFAVNTALTTHLKGAHGVVLEKTKDMLPRSKKDAFDAKE